MPGITAIRCEGLPVPDPPPSLRIPHLGLLEKARKGLHAIPSTSTYLVEFQDALAAALAPAKMYLEILEVVNAIYKCLKELPQAILTLNVDAILDCFKNLTKAIRVMLAYIPPFSWLNTALDIADYAIDLVDEIIQIFVEVDAKITTLLKGVKYAQDMLNTDLEGLIDCDLDDLKALLMNIDPILKFIMPGQKILLEVLYKSLGDPRLKIALEKMNVMVLWFPVAFAAAAAGEDVPPPPLGLEVPDYVTQDPKVPVPPMGNILVTINEARNTTVEVYNYLAPLVGREADKRTRILPTFRNF